MMQLLLPLLFGGGLFFYLCRIWGERKIRWLGGMLILLGTLCFTLYAYGMIGVGLSSFILDLFEKAGIIT